MHYVENKIRLIKSGKNKNKENNIDFAMEIFEKLILKFKHFASTLNLKEEDLYFYYERFPNNTSLLALKIKKGNNNRENFAFIGCNSRVIEKKVFCNIELYSDSGKEAMNMANLLVNDIVEFFQNLENEIYNKKIDCDNLIKIISMSDINEKEDNKKHIKLLDRIFKK